MTRISKGKHISLRTSSHAIGAQAGLRLGREVGILLQIKKVVARSRIYLQKDSYYIEEANT